MHVFSSLRRSYLRISSLLLPLLSHAISSEGMYACLHGEALSNRCSHEHAMLGLAFSFAAELLISLHVSPTAPPTHISPSSPIKAAFPSHKNYVVGLQLSLVEKEDPSRVGEGSQEGNKVRICLPRGLLVSSSLSLSSLSCVTFFYISNHFVSVQPTSTCR